MNLPAIAAALAAAVFFALAATLQHHAAYHEVVHRLLDVRLLWRLLHHRLWVGGQFIDLIGLGLHITALHIGTLVLVQPVMISGLLLSVPMEAALDRRRPRRRDLTGVALATAGLAAFLVAADRAPAPAARPAPLGSSAAAWSAWPWQACSSCPTAHEGDHSRGPAWGWPPGPCTASVRHCSRPVPTC